LLKKPQVNGGELRSRLEGWTWEDTPQALPNLEGRLAAAHSPVLATLVRRFQEVVEIAIA